jgi:hypothetical protein
MINKKINIDKHDSNTTVHAVYGCTSMVSYGIRPYCQLITQIPDGMGAGAVIRHRTTVDVWHGAQPYLSFIVEGRGCVISRAIDNMFVNL